MFILFPYLVKRAEGTSSAQTINSFILKLLYIWIPGGGHKWLWFTAYPKYMFFENGLKFLKKLDIILGQSEDKEYDFAIRFVEF